MRSEMARSLFFSCVASRADTRTSAWLATLPFVHMRAPSAIHTVRRVFASEYILKCPCPSKSYCSHD